MPSESAPLPPRRAWLRGSLAALALGATAGCEPGRPAGYPGRLVGMPPDPGHRLLARAGTAPSTPGLQRRARVVVAGGGIAGLAAACALARRGVREVLLLEANEATGGNASWGRNEVSAYPWGAHYVPLVRADCEPVLDLFTELRIILDRDARGLPVYEETFLSADPQERLWMYGRWHEGLVPQVGASAQDHAQLRAFFAETERLKHARGRDGRPVFAIPVDASSADPQWRALDTLSFAQYLDQRGWTAAPLRWYLDYCCRDDYGATTATTSAWAGLHYFAARNGAAANADSGSVITWPEGNGWLARALAARGIERCGQVQARAAVTRIARQGRGVEVDYFDAELDRAVRVQADAAIVCLPRFAAARVVEDPAGQLAADAAAFSYAPWMVANLTLDRLPGGDGQALAWDNVIYDSRLLGYVVATHQGLARQPRRTVLTYYWPLTHAEPKAARSWAYGRELADWQGEVAHDLLRVHPELDGAIRNIDVRVWGHGMVRPAPGLIWGAARERARRHRPPLYFAHSDLSGLSIFEEAYCRGLAAGEEAAQALDRGATAGAA